MLDDGIVGDPMEKTTLDALNWKLSAGDKLAPTSDALIKDKVSVTVKRRFQFSSQLKRMSTISLVQNAPSSASRTLVAVKGAPETLKKMYKSVPEDYEKTYKWYAQRGSRVLALGYKWVDGMSAKEVRFFPFLLAPVLELTALHTQVTTIPRERVEAELEFAGFLVFHCPLKPDAISTLKALADSSHRCVMITGDNPLTAAHVAREVEIVDREVLILDLKEGAEKEDGAFTFPPSFGLS